MRYVARSFAREAREPIVILASRMTRVLATGATGFIGAQVLEPLRRAGHELHAVSRTARPPDADVVWHDVDLLAPGAAARLVAEIRPEKLMHLAWYAEHGRFWTAPENVAWAEATLSLLRAFVDAGGRRVVIGGTCAEYDWSHAVLSEATTPLAPATLYGISKHATRLLAAAYAREVGFELAWGRVFFLYGPGEAPERLVPSIARALLAGEEAQTTSGTQVRDFMHVSDVGAAFAALLDSPVQGPVNIATGQGVAVRDLVELVGRHVGHPELLRIGALPQRDGEPPELVADVAILREQVGFTPAYSLDRGLADAVEWWRRTLRG